MAYQTTTFDSGGKNTETIAVSIIIVNYFTCDLVKKCLSSIQEKTKGIAYEVIIIDNSNNDEEFKKIDSLHSLFNFPIHTIRAIQNLGFGRANNVAEKQAKGKYLLLLNSDTFLLNNAIFELWTYLENNLRVGIVGPNIYSDHGEPIFSFSPRKITPKSPLFETLLIPALWYRLLRKKPWNNKTNKPLEVKGYITGACLLIRKTVFEKANGFDERIFMYSEDSLLSYQISKMGYLLFNVPSAKIVHSEGASSSKLFTDFKISCMVKGALIYGKEVFGVKKCKRYLSSLSISSAILSLRCKIKNDKINETNYWRMHKAYKESAHKKEL